MTGYIIAAVLWGVIGLIAVGLLWAATVFTTGVLAVTAVEQGQGSWRPATSMITGIIVTISAFVLVVVMTITNIVNAVNAGG